MHLLYLLTDKTASNSVFSNVHAASGMFRSSCSIFRSAKSSATIYAERRSLQLLVGNFQNRGDFYDFVVQFSAVVPQAIIRQSISLYLLPTTSGCDSRKISQTEIDSPKTGKTIKNDNQQPALRQFDILRSRCKARCQTNDGNQTDNQQSNDWKTGACKLVVESFSCFAIFEIFS